MDHPNRKPTRMRSFDYSGNYAYFVTVCALNRSGILADICRDGALLRPIGKIVEREISNLSDRYDVRVDHYVIMPNHIHMILTLQNREEKRPAAALSDMLCTLKSVTTKQANRLDGCMGRRIWQRSFHDHVIRDEKDYLKIWQYIDENPLKWEQDCFYGGTELIIVNDHAT